MKNLYKILVLNILFIFSGCQEDWLEPEPLSFYSPNNAFKTPDGIDAALLRGRLALREEYEGDFWWRLNSEYVWTDVAIQGSANAGHPHDAVTQLIPASDPGTFVKEWYWRNSYQVIAVMNLIIKNIDQPAYKDENLRNALLAEAYFHRAYWYYRLVHQFGDVPFIGQEVNTPKLDFQTFTREAILQKIKKDMEFAVEWLPQNVDGGKVNSAAGNHLLTKIYLSVREFDNAITASSRIINGITHSLMTERFGSGRFAGDPAYNVMWDLYQKENIGSKENKEAILIAPNAFGMEGNSNTNKGNMSVRNWTPNWYQMPGMRYTENNPDPQSAELGRGVGYIRPAPYLGHTLANEDPNDMRYSSVNWHRITDLVYNNPGSPKFGKPFTMADYKARGIDSIRNNYPFHKNKFLIPQTNERVGQYEGGFSDQYIFRIAETYLLRAEAYWWNDDLENAAADVNKVRARANASQKTPSDITIDYIFDERARELYGEEPRRTEIARVSYMMASLGKEGYSLENMHEKNWYYDRIMRRNEFYSRGDVVYVGHPLRVAPYHVYWPVPQGAIDANTGNVINQNKGYQGAENNVAPKTEITDED